MKKKEQIRIGPHLVSYSYPTGESIHWLRFKKEMWRIRTTSNLNKSYIYNLKEIIDKSYEILINQVAGGIVLVDNEASFQLQFAYILKTIGELYRFRPDDLFTIELENNFKFKISLPKSGSVNARIDIVLTLGNFNNFATAAVELKFFKKKNHREPNNRYDVFKDIQNLEAYKNENIFDHTVFLLGTDHEHYVNQSEYQSATADFDFRENSRYTALTELNYRTKKPYGKPITLNQDYNFKWNTVQRQFGHNDEGNLFFLKIDV